jgi:rhodanese-related sulfurtransferase
MADDQEFSISGNVQGENTAPVLGVNSETGDVLAVWEARGENDITIYSALVRREEGGTYSVKKRQILWAPENGGFYQNPDVAFNPVDKSYLVVCHNGYTGHAYAQVIKENGTTKGGPKMISGTDKWMSTVKICFIPDSENKYTSGAFMAVYNMGYDIDSFFETGLYKHGLYSGVLSASGEMTTTPKLLLKTKVKDVHYYYKYPCELVLGRANSFFLSYRIHHELFFS